jgi:glycosyltransferase involved in cell wall biosynthesis
MWLRTVFENAALCRAASQAGETRPPSVVYSLRPMYMNAARCLAKQWDACLVNRIYGTLLYQELTGGRRERPFVEHLVERKGWQREADATIITNDGTNGDKVADLLGVPKDRYYLWFNGINKTNTVTSEAAVSFRSGIGLSRENFVLLCLSRLERWKRQDRVIRSLAHVIREVPRARLIIAGDGRRRASLEEMAARLNLTAYVTFVGAVPHSEVSTVMTAADVFLQTNNYSNLGNTLLEAMACGRPIVTWDAGATSQVIQDYQTGRLLPDPEPETIARAVIELATDPALSRRLGENARRFAEERLPSWEQRVQLETELIETLCARRNRAETSR